MCALSLRTGPAWSNMTSYEDDLIAERRRMLERLRDTADEFRSIEQRFMPIASYRKSLREQLLETYSAGLVASRDHRLSLWAILDGVTHQHSIASTERHRNPNGTGLFRDYREMKARVTAYQREVDRLERAIERERNRPKLPAKAAKQGGISSHGTLFD